MESSASAEPSWQHAPLATHWVNEPAGDGCPANIWLQLHKVPQERIAWLGYFQILDSQNQEQKTEAAMLWGNLLWRDPASNNYLNHEVTTASNYYCNLNSMAGRDAGGGEIKL